MSDQTNQDAKPQDGRSDAVEYVILIVGDADRWWTSMTEEQRAEGYQAYERFDAALTQGGHEIVGGAELHGNANARRIPAGGGPATAGPFAEVTEQVGGFYQVRSADLDGLLEACQIIAGLGDTIEVRQVVTPDEREG